MPAYSPGAISSGSRVPIPPKTSWQSTDPWIVVSSASPRTDSARGCRRRFRRGPGPPGHARASTPSAAAGRRRAAGRVGIGAGPHQTSDQRRIIAHGRVAEHVGIDAAARALSSHHRARGFVEGIVLPEQGDEPAGIDPSVPERADVHADRGSPDRPAEVYGRVPPLSRRRHDDDAIMSASAGTDPAIRSLTTHWRPV